MHSRPPDSQRKSPHAENHGGPKLETSRIATTNSTPLDLQARKLRRLFSFAHATARTIATLAYGVAR